MKREMLDSELQNEILIPVVRCLEEAIRHTNNSINKHTEDIRLEGVLKQIQRIVCNCPQKDNP